MTENEAASIARDTGLSAADVREVAAWERAKKVEQPHAQRLDEDAIWLAFKARFGRVKAQAVCWRVMFLRENGTLYRSPGQ